MNKTRLEAFSDGVFAIIITIMVLELKVPHGHELADLRPLVSGFTIYLLSFIFVGIYWNNHHHVLHAVTQVNGAVLWANLHLLFWLSLIPFATTWLGESELATFPVVLYGLDLLACAVAFTLLTRVLIAHHGEGSILAKAVGDDRKGVVSLVAYAMAVPAAFFHTWISVGLFVLVALIWLIPDRRIERRVEE